MFVFMIHDCACRIIGGRAGICGTDTGATQHEHTCPWGTRALVPPGAVARADTCQVRVAVHIAHRQLGHTCSVTRSRTWRGFVLDGSKSATRDEVTNGVHVVLALAGTWVCRHKTA